MREDSSRPDEAQLAKPAQVPGRSKLTMPLEDAMRSQRSIRRLKADPVDDALVRHLIELALKAPTGSNGQNWEFVVVKDRAVKQRLGWLNAMSWTLYGSVNRRRHRDNPKQLRLLDATQWQAEHFTEIPVLIVACLRGPRPNFPPIAAASYYGSLFPTVQNLLLAARAAELGAGLITLPLWSTYLARRTLGLPRRVTPCAVIPLGWPEGRYGPTTRRPVEEVLHTLIATERPWSEPSRHTRTVPQAEPSQETLRLTGSVPMSCPVGVEGERDGEP